MTYAHITGDTFTLHPRHPTIENDGTRDWDLRDPTIRAARGWIEVTETPRPADTTEGTHDGSVALVDGLPVRVWTFRVWTAEELAAQAEAAAYEAQQAVDRAILDATAALMADAHEDGEAWTQPVGAHNAYPLGRTVTFDGKTWENITPANVWTPGVSGWREVVAEGYPAWVQPTGAHDAYPLDAEVTYNGRAWRNTHPSNAYEPGVYGWADLGPA